MLTKTSKIVEEQTDEAEKKVGAVHNEFAKTLDVMTRAAMSCATAELERGFKLSQELGTARSLADTMSAYQEWLTEEMNARTEDARQFMANCQRFIAEGTRFFRAMGRTGA
jgi:hypothetical protein